MDFAFHRYYNLMWRSFMHIFRRYRKTSITVAVCIYAAIVLIFGRQLAISSNYFVILPVFVTVMAYGSIGGLVSGTLGLPANLLLFYIIGHSEFSPESKLIAQVSGMIIGSIAGFLCDYFFLFEKELQQRREVEADLRRMLHTRDVLLQELNHRVKNNLNLITSLARLHSRRVDDPRFVAECEKFIERIYAMAMVHDLLYRGKNPDYIRLDLYLKRLLESLASAHSKDVMSLSREMDLQELVIGISQAVSVGMILNEVIVNALKHAFTDTANPRVVLTMNVEAGPDEKQNVEICFSDNGIGLDESEKGKGLGSRLIPLLARQAGAEYHYGSINNAGKSGTRFALRFSVHPVPERLSLVD